MSEPLMLAQMGCDFGVLWMVLVWGVWSYDATMPRLVEFEGH